MDGSVRGRLAGLARLCRNHRFPLARPRQARPFGREVPRGRTLRRRRAPPLCLWHEMNHANRQASRRQDRRMGTTSPRAVAADRSQRGPAARRSRRGARQVASRLAATLLGAVLSGASPASAQATKAAAPTGSTWLDNLSRVAPRRSSPAPGGRPRARARRQRAVCRLGHAGRGDANARAGRDQLARHPRRDAPPIGGFPRRIPLRGDRGSDRSRLGPGRAGHLASERPADADGRQRPAVGRPAAIAGYGGGNYRLDRPLRAATWRPARSSPTR